MMQKAMVGGTSRTLLSISFLSSTKHYCHYPFPSKPFRVLAGFKPFCTAITPIPTPTSITIEPDQLKHSMLLERLRMRHLKDSTKTTPSSPSPSKPGENQKLAAFDKESEKKKKKKGMMVESFEELGLSEEVMGAVRELGIEVPTEIQCIGIPSVLEQKSVVLGSHTGSGKTLAYMLPLVQCFEPEHVAKVTGMLLEMDQTEVLHLLESPDALKKKVAEAMAVLQDSAAGESDVSKELGVIGTD